MDSNQEDNKFKADIPTWQAGGRTGHIPVKGGEVFFRIYGEDKLGIPLIFVHEGPGHSFLTFFKTTALAEDRPVVFYNQLGSNGSNIAEEFQNAGKLKELFTIERFTDELEVVVEYFGFKEYVLIGHSWGTMLAIEYAGTKKAVGLKGIVLVGPFLNVDLWLLDAKRLIKSLPDGDKKWQVVKECEATGNYTEEYEKINSIYSNTFFNRTEGPDIKSPPEPEKQNIEGFDVYNHMWGPTEFSCTGFLQGHDSTRLLKNINVPILYISGEYDSGSPAAANYYKTLTPNGKVVVVQGTGHETPRENPQEFMKIVRSFFSELES